MNKITASARVTDGGKSVDINCHCSCGAHIRKHLKVKPKIRRHGMSGMAEYDILRSAIRRCHNKKHHQFYLYGGRGISVCKEWRDDPRAFYKHIGPRPSSQHSLDRINNEGNYEPGNVRWATWRTQKRNMRHNVWVEAFGRRMVLEDWAKETGLDRQTIRYRMEVLGKSPEEAMSLKRQRAGRPKKMLIHPETGEVMCLTDWAKQIGVTPAAITLRMKVTDSVAEILRPANPGIKLRR